MVYALDTLDQKFDVVYCCFVLHHVHKQCHDREQVKSVLKPGGMYIGIEEIINMSTAIQHILYGNNHLMDHIKWLMRIMQEHESAGSWRDDHWWYDSHHITDDKVSCSQGNASRISTKRIKFLKSAVRESKWWQTV